MPSGKILWLCEEHQQLPRVTVLVSDADVIDSPVEAEELQLMNFDTALLMALQSYSDRKEKLTEEDKHPPLQRS